MQRTAACLGTGTDQLGLPTPVDKCLVQATRLLQCRGRVLSWGLCTHVAGEHPRRTPQLSAVWLSRMRPSQGLVGCVWCGAQQRHGHRLYACQTGCCAVNSHCCCTVCASSTRQICHFSWSAESPPAFEVRACWGVAEPAHLHAFPRDAGRVGTQKVLAQHSASPVVVACAALTQLTDPTGRVSMCGVALQPP